MTDEEKVIKTASAKHDIDTLQSLLDHKSPLYNAGSTISKIMATPDYKEFVLLSRAKYKIPLGTTPFGSLQYQQQRQIVIMLKEAVSAYLADLELKPTRNEE